MADIALVQNSTEALKHRCVSLRRVFLEKSTSFASETNSDFDRVVSGPLEEKDENLESNQLVGNALVDKMGDECGGGVTNSL